MESYWLLWLVYIYIYIYICTLCPLLKSYMFTINYPPINHLTTWKTHVGPFWHWLYHSGCKAHNWNRPGGSFSCEKSWWLGRRLWEMPSPRYVINDGSPHVPGLQLFDNLEGCLYRFKKRLMIAIFFLGIHCTWRGVFSQQYDLSWSVVFIGMSQRWTPKIIHGSSFSAANFLLDLWISCEYVKQNM